MDPRIENGALVVIDVDTDYRHAKPSYIRVESIDGARHRDDNTCWIDYGSHSFVARGSAATIHALVWSPQSPIGPWERWWDGWVRRHTGADGRVCASAYPHEARDYWIWTASTRSGPRSGRCDNEQDARDCADRALAERDDQPPGERDGAT